MNKAHTATAKRIAKRYGLLYTGAENATEPDLTGLDAEGRPLSIEIETSATLTDAVHRLASFSGRIYIAVTNKEALIDAVRLTKKTPIGVMDPRGEIVKECAELSFPASPANLNSAASPATPDLPQRSRDERGEAQRKNIDIAKTQRAEECIRDAGNGDEANRVVPRFEPAGYTKEPARGPTFDASFEPIYVATAAEQSAEPTAGQSGATARRAFTIPDAAALSQPLSVGFRSDGARLAAG